VDFSVLEPHNDARPHRYRNELRGYYAQRVGLEREREERSGVRGGDGKGVSEELGAGWGAELSQDMDEGSLLERRKKYVMKARDFFREDVWL